MATEISKFKVKETGQIPILPRKKKKNYEYLKQ